MDNTSQFQSKTSDLSPDHDNSDKLVRNNLIKNITTVLVNSKMKN